MPRAISTSCSNISYQLRFPRLSVSFCCLLLAAKAVLGDELEAVEVVLCAGTNDKERWMNPYSLTMSKLRNRRRGCAVIGSYRVRGRSHSYGEPCHSLPFILTSVYHSSQGSLIFYAPRKLKSSRGSLPNQASGDAVLSPSRQDYEVAD